ncbi:MAG: NAD-dependent epimerase/dehydratase family protein, partial [Hyphomicrobiales bacterium]
MKILVIGAAGMVGRKLTSALLQAGQIGGQDISALVLADIVAPQAPDASVPIETHAIDLSAPEAAAKLIVSRPDLIFHLAAIVSGEAEADFEKGYRINLDGTRHLLEAIRLAGQHGSYVPRLVFT